MTVNSLHSFIVILLLLISNGVSAQKSTDSTQTIKYFRLFDKFEYEDTLRARMYADSGLYFANRSGNDGLIGRAHRFMGWYYQDRGKFITANDHFYKSLSYLRKAKNLQGIADAYGNLGNSFLDVEDY